MSDPARRGRARPMRVAGLALLGVAAGALLVGVITLSGQNGSNGGGGGATASGGTPTFPSPGGATTATGGLTPATTPPPQPVHPTTTAAQAPSLPPPPSPTEPKAPIRVLNNSKITGLAAQAADDFRRNGWEVVEVSNYARSIIPTSTVYFRPDNTNEEAAARRLGQRFNLKVEQRFAGIAGAGPGLIVIVTNDYGSK